MIVDKRTLETGKNFVFTERPDDPDTAWLFGGREICGTQRAPVGLDHYDKDPDVADEGED